MLTHEYPPYPGGVGRYCASLAEAAAQAGHQVTVLAPNHNQQPTGQTQLNGVTVIRFAGDIFHFKHLQIFRAHIRQVLSQAPLHFDIIHAADWPAIVAMRNIATPGTVRLASLHGTDIFVLTRSIRARLARAYKAMASFDRYVCNSQFTQSLLRQHYPKLASRSSVTPLGVDAGWFNAPPAVDKASLLTNHIQKQDQDLIVLTVARLDERKGQLRTIKALSQLPAPLKARVQYVCVGQEVDEGYGVKLKNAAKEGNVRLTLTGRLTDNELKAAYSIANVFALTGENVPERVEGFGLVLLEAAAQGVPAVVTHLQALPEVVVHGQTGWVCANDLDLTDAFQAALTQADLAELAKHCIQRATEFTWNRCASLTYGAQV